MMAAVQVSPTAANSTRRPGLDAAPVECGLDDWWGLGAHDEVAVGTLTATVAGPQ
jgi:hypothetical protein